MGIETLKNPLDCWIYQEILFKVRPDVLIEVGSFSGGSTMFFCHMMDIIDHGQVVSVDIDRSHYRAEHPRLTDITGDCSDRAIVAEVRRVCRNKSAIVVHDGDHREEAVLRDMRIYADFVSVGSYLIVEDGVVDLFDRATPLGWKQRGPLRAIERFLQEDGRFEIDADCERFLITWNPKGYLRRTT